MRDPDLVERAQRAAMALERAWDRFRTSHGLGAEPLAPVSSYVGYSLEEPWGEPRVVFGVAAEEAEKLAALLNGHDCGGRPAPGRPAVANGRLVGLTAAAEIARAAASARLQVPNQPPASARDRFRNGRPPAVPGRPGDSRPAEDSPRSNGAPRSDGALGFDGPPGANGSPHSSGSSTGTAVCSPGQDATDFADVPERPSSGPQQSPHPAQPAPLAPATAIAPETRPDVPSRSDLLSQPASSAASVTPTPAALADPPVPAAAAAPPVTPATLSPPATTLSQAGATRPVPPPGETAMADAQRPDRVVAEPAEGHETGLMAFRPGAASLPGDPGEPDPFAAGHGAGGQPSQRPRSHRHAMQRSARQKRGSAEAEAGPQPPAMQPSAMPAQAARRAGGQRHATTGADAGELAAMADDLAGWASSELPGQASRQTAPWTPAYREPGDTDPAGGISCRDKVI